ncbi:MAG: flagellar biosynthesis protein FlhF [Eubacterium sp.]|nr:flagellar biosynthesis protein FlhF [Eubacterium sp.]
MIIKKYLAKTEKDAIEKAKEELGSSAIVMNVKKVHPRGLMRIFLRAKVEVTAALDENTNYSEEKKEPTRPAAGDGHKSKFDVSIPPLEGLPPLEKPAPAATARTGAEKQNNEERLSQLFALLEKQMADKDAVAPAPRTSQSAPQRQESARTTERRPEPPKASAAERPRPETEKKESTRKDTIKSSESITDEESKDRETEGAEEKDKGAVYRDLIYKQLVGNEVDPEIADRILDEAKHALPKDAAVDQILGSVYQRIILMLGQPYTINYKPNEPTKFVFFLGSTGVGKTTTIAKLASRLKLEQNCKLALVTADTYRMAAVDQLQKYTEILNVPLYVAWKPEELREMLDDLERYDVVLIDTAGCSHRNREQIDNLRILLEQVPITKRLVYLALSVGTKYRDLKEICKVYSDLTDYSIIFTKLDETSSAGVMLNMKLETKCPLSYITNGQEVPDDISVIDAQAVAKQLMS